MRNKSKLQKLEKTAYHEAGHAIMSYYLHVRFTYVTIIPEEDCLGRVTHPESYFENFHPDYDNSPKAVAKSEKRISVLLAGQVAEKLFSGRHNWRGSGTDWSNAVKFASYLVGSEEELNAYTNYLWVRTKQTLKLPWLWAAAQALASELLEHKKIGYRQARKIIKQGIENYRIEREAGNKRPRKKDPV